MPTKWKQVRFQRRSYPCNEIISEGCIWNWRSLQGVQHIPSNFDLLADFPDVSRLWRGDLDGTGQHGAYDGSKAEKRSFEH